jgi:DNA-directed RNA polymerase specialized sigma subunit
VNAECEYSHPKISRMVLLARDAVRRLAEDEQLVLQLIYVEGLNVTEAAKVLRVSVEKIAETHSRAITNFRKILLHEVYQAEIDDC